MQRFNEKDYISVQDRINRFWSEHKNGAIVTEVVTDMGDFDHVVVKASVYTDRTTEGYVPVATGIAAETRGASFKDGANFTSWHENAETSAIGRALANMGYATSQADRMSREEAQKVNRAADAAEEWEAGRAAMLPARDRSTNALPNVAQGNVATSDEPITNWTVFWQRVKAMGITADKKQLEVNLGETLPFDPALALKKVQAWVHDTERQAALP